jgi:hypothetical protein
MREKKLKDEANHMKEKEFHRTHFGPEETFEVS